MTLLSRRSLLCAFAACVATGLLAHCDAAERVARDDWAPVHVNLHYLKSQESKLAPAMADLENLFPRRIPIAISSDFNGLPRAAFYIELTERLLESEDSWTLIHDRGGSILLATDAKQLSAALKHLQTIARKGPARDDEHPAYPRGIPQVVHLPVGVTTSMPVHHVATIGLNTAAAQQRRPPTAYGVLYKEWKAEVKALDEAVPELSSSEKRDKKRDINTKYTPRFLKLAKEHLDDDLWLDCLIWTSVEGIPGEAFDAMFDILRDSAKGVRNTTQLRLLMSEFIKLQSARIDRALSAIAENHGNAGVRGAALYALAARIKRRAEEHGDVEGCATAERLLERVIAEYPEVSTYRGENLENATALLDELRSPVAITKTAPNTQGKTISGDEFHLSEAIRGRVAVISFSGHWCGPCVAMHPIQKEIMSKFPKESVVIVEMNSDQPDSLEKVREKIESDGLGWIVVSDGSNGPISEQWRITTWPTYFVVDTEGRIRRRVSGNVGRRLTAWVEELVPKSE